MYFNHQKSLKIVENQILHEKIHGLKDGIKINVNLESCLENTNRRQTETGIKGCFFQRCISGPKNWP